MLRALADAFPDLDGLGNLVIGDAQVQRLAAVVAPAKMAVGADGGADGDQLTHAIVEFHG